MNISQLRKLLERLQACYADAGAEKQATAVGRFKQVFDGPQDQTVEAKLEELGASTDVASLYSRELDALDGDESKFREVMRRLAADKRVDKIAAISIAEQYAKRKCDSRKMALTAINRRFVERARAANEATYLENRKVTPW